MGAPGDQAIMRGGVEDADLRADFFQPAAKFRGGRAAAGGGQNPGASPEKVSVSGFGASLLFACHGVPADERAAMQVGGRGFADGGLGAAGVGDERVRL